LSSPQLFERPETRGAKAHIDERQERRPGANDENKLMKKRT
jgi:hypothetical protein